MTERYNQIDEDAIRATQADYDPYFRLHRPTGAPPPLEREPNSAYRRRLAEGLQQHAPHCQDFNVRHSTGTAFDTLEKQIKADAQREAVMPSVVPEGTLKEVVSYDAAGRPSRTFWGSPKVWMDEFASPKKRLVGIRTETERGYRPGNLG
jgi:hypothetical protein